MKITFEIQTQTCSIQEINKPQPRKCHEYCDGTPTPSPQRAICKPDLIPAGHVQMTQIIPRLLTAKFVLVIHQENQEETLFPVSRPLVSWNSHCVCSSKHI